MKITIKVEGMHCEHCASRIKEALPNIDGVISTLVQLDTKTVLVETSKEIELSFLKNKIEDLDYQVDDIKIN